FFEAPARAPHRPAQRVDADGEGLLGLLAGGVLGDGVVGVGTQLGLEGGVIQGREGAWAAGSPAGGERTGPVAARRVLLDGGERDAEGAARFGLGHPAVDGAHDSFPQVLRGGLHARSILPAVPLRHLLYVVETEPDEIATCLSQTTFVSQGREYELTCFERDAAAPSVLISPGSGGHAYVFAELAYQTHQERYNVF